MSQELILTLGTSQRQTLVMETPIPQSLFLNRALADGARAKIYQDTTEHWNEKLDYIPDAISIVVYTDRNIIDGVHYCGVKIGDGTTYLADLPFVGDDVVMRVMGVINDHINNSDIHVTAQEKTFWNNKVNVRINSETLIINRL